MTMGKTGNVSGSGEVSGKVFRRDRAAVMLAVLAAASVVCTPLAQAQNVPWGVIVDQVLKRGGGTQKPDESTSETKGGATSSTTTAPATGAADPAASQLAPITSEQSQKITAQLTAPIPATLSQDRSDAEELIGQILVIASCGLQSSAWQALNDRRVHAQIYSAAQRSLYSALAQTKNQNGGQCLNVTMVTDWARPVKNALSFTVVMGSDMTAQTPRQNFALQKNGAGDWQIRTISVARM